MRAPILLRYNSAAAAAKYTSSVVKEHVSKPKILILNDKMNFMTVETRRNVLVTAQVGTNNVRSDAFEGNFSMGNRI